MGTSEPVILKHQDGTEEICRINGGFPEVIIQGSKVFKFVGAEELFKETEAYFSLTTISELEKAKNTAYKERNALVLLLSKIFPSWLGRHPAEDKDWEDDWRWIVFIMLPTGQCSWHIHDSEWQDFANHLDEVKENKWDGHSTEEKYQRIERYQPLDECFFCGMRISNPGHIVDGKLTCNQ